MEKSYRLRSVTFRLSAARIAPVSLSVTFSTICVVFSPLSDGTSGSTGGLIWKKRISGVTVTIW